MPTYPQCQYRTPQSGRASLCALGMYGGKVTDGTCRRCIRLEQNNPDYAAALFSRAEHSHPAARARLSGCCAPQNPKKMALGLAKSMLGWAASGFKMATQPIFEKRLAICIDCEKYDPKGMGGGGKCLECGCAIQAKLRLATTSCPLKKWACVS